MIIDIIINSVDFIFAEYIKQLEMLNSTSIDGTRAVTS